MAAKGERERIAELSRLVFASDPSGLQRSVSADVAMQLAGMRSVWVLPVLVELVLEEPVRDEVAAAVVAIVEQADPARLAAADAEVRRGSAWSSGWHQLRGGALSSLERMASDCAHPGGVLLAAGMCRNGYMREAALRLADRLTEVAIEGSWRLRLMRANDWVPQVQQVALAGLQTTAATITGAVLVRSLPLVIRLYRVGRLEDPAVVDRLSAEAVGVHWAELLAGLRTPVLSVRRACAQLSLTAPPERQQQAVETILTFVWTRCHDGLPPRRYWTPTTL